MKKKAAKSTPQPSFESLIKSVSWVRLIEEKSRAYGIGYRDGVLCEVMVKNANSLEPATIESEPRTLAESAERLSFIIEVERTFGHCSTTDDPAHLRWLSELETKLAA